MTGAEMTPEAARERLAQIAPWPDGDVAAHDLTAWFAVRAVRAWTRLTTPPGPRDEVTDLTVTLSGWTVALLLRALAEAARDIAEDAAREIREAWDGGEEIGERLHRLVAGLGIDAEVITRLEAATWPRNTPDGPGPHEDTREGTIVRESGRESRATASCACGLPLLALRDAHAAVARLLSDRPSDTVVSQEQVTETALRAAAPHIRAGERARIHGETHDLVRDFGGKRPEIVVLCGSTRFVDEFNRQRKTLTEHGEIVLSIEVVTTQAREHDPQHADPALKGRLDELHKRKIDLADYVLVVSDETGYFGESTKGEIRYAVEHGKPVRFAEDAAHRAAWDAGIIPAVMCGCTQIPEMPLCEHQRQGCQGAGMTRDGLAVEMAAALARHGIKVPEELADDLLLLSYEYADTQVDDLVGRILDHAGPEWDRDEAGEDIAVAYVRHLEDQAEGATAKLIAIRRYIEHHAADFSGTVFQVPPRNMRIGAAVVLDIIDGRRRPRESHQCPLNGGALAAWDSSVLPGGFVCAEPDSPAAWCGYPVESVPCPVHAAEVYEEAQQDAR